MIIYALVDPRDGRTRYIGKTVRQARQRLREHIAAKFMRGESNKERWVRILLRLGLKPQLLIVQTCTSAAALAEAERGHIARLLAGGAALTNATPGGETTFVAHRQESKDKIRNALIGRVFTASARRRMSQAAIGRRHSAETRAKMRAAHGRPRGPLSRRHRLILAKAHGGRPFVDQHGTRYETQMGAARLLGISAGHLNQVLHGTRKSAGGFIFMFESQRRAQ